MSRTILTWVGMALSAVVSLHAATPQSAGTSQPGSAYRMVLDRYCVTCHNEKLKTANLMLDKMDVENPAVGTEVWEKVIRKLRTASMPPAGMPRPDQATYNSFANYLGTAIDRDAAAKPNPGRAAAIHRLNRTEYANAIRDLLALEIDSESLLPADESSAGFDNNGDVLAVSPAILDRYMSAARQVSRQAIGDTGIRADSHTYTLPEALGQNERMSEDLPFGSRGGMAIRYHFPVDGEYVIKIGLLKSAAPNSRGTIIGLSEPHQLDVRVDGVKVKRLTVGGEQNGKPDADLEVHFSANAGTHLVGVAFLNDIGEPEGESEGMLRPPLAALNSLWKPQDGEPAVETVTIGGPYSAKGLGDTASRRKILVCRPVGTQDEELCAKKIFSILTRHSYRRPVTDSDIQPLLTLYRAAHAKGGFEAGIRIALERILISPEFLFRIEHDPVNAAPNAVHRITDLELASRLSFFLWSSIPDEPLLALAERNRLKDPAVLEQQVRRMLADSRAKALATNFFGQWLQLRNVKSAQPDIDMFTDFDENLRDAFMQEADLFFESILLEDHSAVDLLNANYTFVNDRLARHYGIPNIYGSFFRRVTLADQRRRGLLGKGSILMLTSMPNRTSPVRRGKFVLENIMGTPPPPPPPNVPSLKEGGRGGMTLTVRQAMEQHRASPVCASCHARMDPLGFALDNFNAIGQWRTTEAGFPIDSSAVLPDGTKFQGVADLQKILLSHPQQFVTVITENLLTYALGRGVDYADEPAVRQIMRQAAPNNYRWSSLVLGIVKSVPFQMRKSPEPVTTADVR